MGVTRSRPSYHGPPSYRLLRAGARFPLVLICEHASAALPPGIRARGRVRDLLPSHWGWDPGAWSVTRELSRIAGAVAVAGRWSRLWIDLNRDVRDVTLIRETADGVPIPWNRRLSPAAREQRVVTDYLPFHQAIDMAIVRRLVRGIHPLVVSVHSFTPELDGRRRPFDIGVLFVHDERLARRAGRTLRGEGFSVRYNEPYSGREGFMYTAHTHATRHGLQCLEIELNQSLPSSPGLVRRIAGSLLDAIS